MNMTQDTPPDALDRLLSDFFASKMRRPWPAAPVPVVAKHAPSLNGYHPEPSSVLGVRNAVARPEPLPAPQNPDNRSRYTLAASVALLLGGCFVLSRSWEPAQPAGKLTPAVQAKPAVDPFKGASADGNDILAPAAKDKATKPPEPRMNDPFGHE